VETRCPGCGASNPPGARFCSNCGAALGEAPPPQEERKLVSVLFVDLVGSTARADNADPEDVRDVLQIYHREAKECIEQYGGVLEKFIGDAVMAVFGAPVAHGDDAERAVRRFTRPRAHRAAERGARPRPCRSGRRKYGRGDRVRRARTRRGCPGDWRCREHRLAPPNGRAARPRRRRRGDAAGDAERDPIRATRAAGGEGQGRRRRRVAGGRGDARTCPTSARADAARRPRPRAGAASLRLGTRVRRA
jgi:Adenylate and Guanylate cyclase catalytic domain/zinc-ribbon domain